MASSDDARDALYLAIAECAAAWKDSISPGERLRELADAWSKLQDEPEEEGDDVVPPMHATSGDSVTFGAGTDSSWYEDRGRIGFAPRS